MLEVATFHDNPVVQWGLPKFEDQACFQKKKKRALCENSSGQGSGTRYSKSYSHS